MKFMQMKLSNIRFLSILILSLFIQQLYGQQFTNFKNFTDMKRVGALQTNSLGIWAATNDMMLSWSVISTSIAIIGYKTTKGMNMMLSWSVVGTAIAIIGYKTMKGMNMML